MEEMTCAAIEKGLSTVAFTEHWDAKETSDEDGYYEKFAQVHFSEVMRMRERFSDKIDIIYGIEVGQIHQNRKAAESFLKAHDFDFIIGSLHDLRAGRDIYHIDYCDMDVVKKTWSDYFDELCEMIDVGGFDCLGHIDYPLRVMGGILKTPTLYEYKDRIDDVLRRMCRCGMALEINTRGLFDWQKRVGPEGFILKRFKELGGEHITIGSDAHVPYALGAGAKEAMEAALSSGFEYFTVYRNRKPEMIKIG